MLKNSFEKLYLKFRASYYKKLVEHIQAREGSLSATEAFCAEIILLLGSPTVSEFADFIGISQPNATYKINNLERKGYIKRVISEGDRREVHLEMSSKALTYFGLNNDAILDVLNKVESSFEPEEIALLEKFITRITDELMV